MAKRKGQTLIQQSRALSSQQKATYHELDGAGKSRVKRAFFGLNAEDEAAILDRIDRGLQERVRD